MIPNEKTEMAIKIIPEIEGMADEIVAMRRDFHMHPEEGFQELRTAGIVAQMLRDFGLEVRENVGKTGVVGDLKGAFPGPSVAFRADMDALPIRETSDVPYKSRNEGVMHACGHDGHTAMLLAVAEVLSREKDTMRGSLRFIFQPSEEKDGGATYMIDDGCLDGIEQIYGAHLWNYIAFGQIGTSPGPVLAATDSLRIAVRGVAGHGAIPQGTVDAIVAGSALVGALQTVVSRNVDPMQSAVVSIGKIAGGDNHNVIASLVEMEGTVRTLSEDIRKTVKERILAIAEGVGKTYGAEIEMGIEKGYPALVNDGRLVEKLIAAAKAVVGEGAGSISPGMGGEDFAYYARKIPGCFFFVGSSPPGFEPGELPHHCSHFDIDERALLVGASVFVRLAKDLLFD